MFKIIRALLALTITIIGVGVGMAVSAVVFLLLTINLFIDEEGVNDITYETMLTVTGPFVYIAALIDRETVVKSLDEVARIYNDKQSKY